MRYLRLHKCCSFVWRPASFFFGRQSVHDLTYDVRWCVTQVHPHDSFEGGNLQRNNWRSWLALTVEPEPRKVIHLQINYSNKVALIEVNLPYGYGVFEECFWLLLLPSCRAKCLIVTDPAGPCVYAIHASYNILQKQQKTHMSAVHERGPYTNDSTVSLVCWSVR